jgi:hypothetical protein
MRSCQLRLKSPLRPGLLPVRENLPIEKCSPSVVSCLKCGDELRAMFLVADQNLQMRHWVQGTAESLEWHWSVTPLSDLSTAPGFVSKDVHAAAASQSGNQNFCVYLFVHRNV